MKKLNNNNGKGNEEGSEAKWLTTFNDLMTLLMVFFVLLFTMGSMDAKKMNHFAHSLQGGLGILNEGQFLKIGIMEPIVKNTKNWKTTETPDENDTTDMDSETDSDDKKKSENKGNGGGNSFLKEVEKLDKVLNDISKQQGISAERTMDGIRIRLEDCILFRLGLSEISPEAHMALKKVATELKKMDNPIRVEGHTDDIPIRSEQFRSNWDLSLSRAVNVVKFFIEHGHIKPERFVAAGYGDSRPICDNHTAENRARNRRVEVILLKKGD